MTLNWYAMNAPIGEGMQILLVQTSNAVLRHCRIGKITLKAGK